MLDREGTPPPRPLLTLVAWVVGLAAVLLLVVGGPAMPTLPRTIAAAPQWVADHGATVAAFSLVRLAVLATTVYLLGTTVLALGAELVGGVRTIRLSRALLTSTQRRLVSAAMGVSLSAVGAVAPAAATPPDHTAVMVMIDEPTTSSSTTDPGPVEIMEVVSPPPTSLPVLPSTTTASPASTQPTATSSTAPAVEEGSSPADLPAASTETADGVDSGAGGGADPGSGNGPASPPHVDGLPPESVARDGAWTIEPGEHLWKVAYETLAASGQVPSDAETERYLDLIVAANLDVFVIAGSPDLVFAGQVFTLPPLEAAAIS